MSTQILISSSPINVDVIDDQVEVVTIYHGTPGPAGATGPAGPTGPQGPSVSDGNKGDITVASSGASWTINAGSVTLADLANISTATILGRTTAGTGAVEALTTAQLRSMLQLATTDVVMHAGLTLTGQSVAGSASTPLLDLSTTWNTTGTPTAHKVNVTDTASNAASLLLDLQVGGVSKCKVSKDGILQAVNGVGFDANSSAASTFINQYGLTIGGTGVVSWRSGGISTTQDLFLFRDAANAMALRNGPNAQSLAVYETQTSGTDYSRLRAYASSGVFRIRTEAAGTGTLRVLSLGANQDLMSFLGGSIRIELDCPFGQTGNDLYFGSGSGMVMRSQTNLEYLIDSDNNSTANYYRWATNSAAFGGGTELMRLTEAGALTLATGPLIIATTATPASATATGTTGQIAWDSGFVYVCTATNTWKRAAIATW